MCKNFLTLVAVATICLAIAACDREPKPDHRGGFLVQIDKLIEQFNERTGLLK